MTRKAYECLLLRTLAACGFYFAYLSASFAEPLEFTLLKTESLTLSGDIVGRYFSVEYTPVNGTNTDGSYLIVIFADSQIPYHHAIKPIAIEKVTCLMQRCSRAVRAPISAIPYIVGIGSGDSANTVSATLLFTPGKLSGTPFRAALEIKSLMINSIVVSYTMPAGYRPSQSGAWLGLWAGTAINGAEPLAKANIDSELSQSTQAINDLVIQSNFVYTLGLAAGPGVGDIASLAVFKTGAY
ncbi:hypothetical protein [Massilia sp. erpn]|uniref:hypothetical protein n=1 Tax=Massilia sp. erpn TaxID=2738142 RepID=UPI0021066856|nr:hypothetical protein [Massilia sp. erpn]UTY59519.1 hypothetical protein HPQ68_21480 [Massilia sp. erpn]